MPNQLDVSRLTLQDSLDLAIHIEQEAHERYLRFAEMMGASYKGDAGDFFLEMARNEAKHADQLTSQRQKLFKNAPRQIDVDKVWDIEAPEFDKPRAFMSPRQAMEVALAAEVKAYEFFRDALKRVTDKKVHALFEELRDEELEHQKLVKQQLSRTPETSGPDRDDDEIDTPSMD